VLSCVCWWFS